MSEWRFEVDEVGEDAEPEERVEAGTPTLENAVFVALGALATLGLLVFVVLA